MGPVSMNTGSAPVTVSAWTRARGVRPCRSTAAGEATMHRGGAVGDLGGRGGGELPALAQRLQLGHLLQGGVAARPLVGGHPGDRGDLARRTGPRRSRAPPAGGSPARTPPAASASSPTSRRSAGRRGTGRSPGCRTGPASPAPNGPGMPFSSGSATVEPMGTMLMLSTPAAMTRSWVPDSTALGGEVDGLLGRAALAVDGDARHALRQPGRQPGIPRDVDGLRARSGRRSP